MDAPKNPEKPVRDEFLLSRLRHHLVYAIKDCDQDEIDRIQKQIKEICGPTDNPER